MNEKLWYIQRMGSDNEWMNDDEWIANTSNNMEESWKYVMQTKQIVARCHLYKKISEQN